MNFQKLLNKIYTFFSKLLFLLNVPNSFIMSEMSMPTMKESMLNSARSRQTVFDLLAKARGMQNTDLLNNYQDYNR